jgi:serine/threonine-protein kinase
MDLAPGTLVTPSLRLVRLLGEGGMGSVWAAHHAGLSAEVAVKFVSPSRLERDAAALGRFSREASLAAQIKSPHVVSVFDHGLTADGTPYIVMELCAGESLAERLKRTRTLAPREAALLVSQVAHVLAEAHARGVVHRDVKPANLFLLASSYEMFVKVLDFGVAKETRVPEVSGMTSTGAIVGTPRYMSPEQLLDAKSADERADLWALAVVAYQALTGALPFQGETLARLSLAIHAGTFAPARAHRPELPSAVDAWLTRALAIDPEARFGSALELAEAFRRAIDAGDDATASTLPSPALARAADAAPPPRVDVPLVDTTPSTADAVPSAPAPPLPRGTLAGAASTLGSARPGVRPRSRVWLAAPLSALALGALALGRGLVSPPPIEVARPLSLALSLPPIATADATPPSASAAPVVAPPADPAPPSTASVSRAPRGAPRAPQGTRAECKQPYTVDAEGILHVKPECL